ncbi:MAG TPA: TIGR03089 family protein [Jiangellales bacterium]|nr:TIGR03089 family protein [Jiangellales bacterium]
MPPVPETPWVTPVGLLRAALAADGSRPLLTSYDEGSGERVELSVTTFDNWVAKTAGLLRDGLGLDPGSRVALLLPAHWQGLVWAAACWTAGCCAVLGQPLDVQLAVTGPDGLAAARASGADEVVALSLLPWGVPFREPLPPGVLDYALEVPVQPDRFVPYGPEVPGDPALDDGGAIRTLAGLVALAGDHAASAGVGEGDRVLRRADDLDVPAVLDLLLVPLLRGGSAVLVRGPVDAGRLARIASDERVDREL